MMAADGELDAAGQAALSDFLARHPELREDAAAWHALRVQPDASLVYAEKEALLRREPKRVSLSWRITLATAATVLFAMVLVSRRPHRDVPQVVHLMPAHQPAAVAAHTVDRPLPEKTLAHVARKRQALRRLAAVRREGQPMMHEREELTTLSSKPIACFETEPLQPSIRAAPTLVADLVPAADEVPKAAEEQSQPLIRLAAANAPAAELFKESVDARVAQISSTVKAIRETAIAVRIGGKNHHLNF